MAVACFFPLVLWDCSAQKQEPEGQKLELTEQQQDSGEYYEDEYGDPGSDYDGNFRHPESYNAFATRALVSSVDLPDSQKIATCKEDVSVIAASALNLQAMVEAEAQTMTLIAADLELYHWCFYVSMVHLDIKMAQSRDTLANVTTMFFTKMRNLWILARALDKSRQSKRYFGYLRQRYMQLSWDYFGRQLEIQGPSAVEIQTADKKRIINPPQKAAAPAPIEATDDEAELMGE